uniref:Uncharacterized protein n=1 Tax=Setaria viridis TaxID=4556 RepID=A0A4U6TR39_SETVI|nr:hypothetical protein SEVIR_7G110700v2 [Setaria viridis]
MQMPTNARGEIRAFSFLHVPIPTALRTSLSSCSLLTNFELKSLETWKIKTCLNFLIRSSKHIALQAKKKRKERLRTIGMGGTGKHQTEASTSVSGGENKLGRVSSMFPFPLLLSSLSSSSQLTLSFQKKKSL